MIGYWLAFSFECQQVNMQKTFLFTFKNWVLVCKIQVFFNEKMVLADVPSCSESLYTDSGFHNYVISTESGYNDS